MYVHKHCLVYSDSPETQFVFKEWINQICCLGDIVNGKDISRNTNIYFSYELMLIDCSDLSICKIESIKQTYCKNSFYLLIKPVCLIDEEKKAYFDLHIERIIEPKINKNLFKSLLDRYTSYANFVKPISHEKKPKFMIFQV